MADWDDEEFELDDNKLEGPRTDKWEGEDEEDDVKDAWDAESDEENKDQKPGEEVVAKPVKVKKKKKLAEIIAEKEEARIREMEERRKLEEEENEINTPEGKLAEKLRQQKMIEDGDFELTKDLLGDVTASSGGINFNPDSKEGFEELRNTLLEKFKNIENSEHYQDFASSLMKDMLMGLPVAQLKIVKADCEGFISVKLKEEKAARAKKGKPGAARATIKMETDRSMFSRGMDEGYNDMDDFM